MCRFKGLALSSMDRVFSFMHKGEGCQILKDGHSKKKKPHSQFSVLFPEGSSNKNPIMYLTEEEMSIFHT